MTFFLRKFLAMNWLIFGLMVGLAVFGIVAVFSASYFKTDDYWHKQFVFAAIGIAIFFAVSLVDYRWIRWGALPMYLAGIVGLILTYTPLGVEHGGATCWLKIPGIPEFQPSQISIIAGIMVLSLFLSQFKHLHPALRVAFCGVIAGAPMLLILKQPDVGMTMTWMPVLLGVMFLGGIPKRYLISIILLGTIALGFAVHFALKPYQQKRLTAFIDPDLDPKGAGWGIKQSLIAIGSGGWSGKGFRAENTQVKLEFIPSTTVHTDYIFTAVGEQWGFQGGIILIGVFAALILAILIVAYQSADDVGLLLSGGIAMMLFFHVYQNIGMTIQLMPITGLPLPLISYGGSFVVVVMFALGLVNSVWIHRRVAG